MKHQGLIFSILFQNFLKSRSNFRVNKSLGQNLWYKWKGLVTRIGMWNGNTLTIIDHEIWATIKFVCTQALGIWPFIPVSWWTTTFEGKHEYFIWDNPCWVSWKSNKHIWRNRKCEKSQRTVSDYNSSLKHWGIENYINPTNLTKKKCT